MKKIIKLTESDLQRIIKKIIRESIISESVTEVKNISDINWYRLVDNGRTVLSTELNSMVNIPIDFWPSVDKIVISLSSNLKESIMSDVINGNLSSNTVKILNNSINNSLNLVFNDPKLNSAFDKIPGTKKFFAKNLGSYTIKNKINEGVTLLGSKFYTEGMSGSLKKYYNLNSPIVKKYIKVLTQLGTNVSNNQSLKDKIYNLIMSKL
jgi:hypothetical protein